MMRLTDVVKNLLIINVIVYLALNFTMLSSFFNYFVLYPLGSEQFQPVQLITSMFNHAPIKPELRWGGSIGLMHIFGNMLTLSFFGPMLESFWGPKRFLFFYLLCGLGADFFHLFAGGGSPVLGASGAIAGVLLAFAYYNPSARIMLLFPPIPIKAKYLVGGLLLFDLYAGLTSMGTGIAHFAHIGGAVVGAILIFFFKKNPDFLK